MAISNIYVALLRLYYLEHLQRLSSLDSKSLLVLVLDSSVCYSPSWLRRLPLVTLSWSESFGRCLMLLNISPLYICLGTAFHALIVRNNGDSSNFAVLCTGMLNRSFDAPLVLLSDTDRCCLYMSLMLLGCLFCSDLWANTASCTIRLWCRLRSFSLVRALVADSDFFIPNMDLAA